MQKYEKLEKIGEGMAIKLFLASITFSNLDVWHFVRGKKIVLTHFIALLTSKFWELLNSEFFLLKKRPEVSIISLLKLGRNAYFKKENNSLL